MRLLRTLKAGLDLLNCASQSCKVRSVGGEGQAVLDF